MAPDVIDKHCLTIACLYFSPRSNDIDLHTTTCPTHYHHQPYNRQHLTTSIYHLRTHIYTATEHLTTIANNKYINDHNVLIVIMAPSCRAVGPTSNLNHTINSARKYFLTFPTSNPQKTYPAWLPLLTTTPLMWKWLILPQACLYLDHLSSDLKSPLRSIWV